MKVFSLEEFDAWVNDPMTCRVRDYMLTNRAEMNDLDQSALLERNVYGDDMTGLERLGLEAVMRASVIKGIDLFTATDDLRDVLNEGEAK